MANVINSLKYNSGNAFIFALPSGSCTTGGGTQTKAVTIEGISTIEEGLMVAIKFSNTNTAANPTLSINSSTASPIYYKGSAIPANAITAGATYQFIYNGTQWELIGDLDTSVAITVTTSGSGNAITSLSASSGTITATKGSTFLTAHPSITKSTNSTSSTSPSHGGSFTVIDSVTQDTNGHITKVNTKTVKLPSASSYTLPTASSTTLGGVKTTSSVTSSTGYTACPIISGVPYYKDSTSLDPIEMYTVTSATLPSALPMGLSSTFVNTDSGFGGYGTVVTAKGYSGGGGSLQLYAPYSSAHGGTHLKARFGNYAVSNGNSWTDLKEVAWLSEVLPLTGGTLTGNLTINNSGATVGMVTVKNSLNQAVSLRSGYLGWSGLWNDTMSRYIINDDGSNTVKVGDSSVSVEVPGDWIGTAQVGGRTSAASSAYLKFGGTYIQFNNSTNQITFNGSALRNTTSGAVTLGNGTYKWGAVYSTTGSIQTSDRNVKDNIQPISDSYKQLFMKLMPVSFTFIDGTSGRTHIGFISQDVEEAMIELGMTSLDFAGFCKDVKTKTIIQKQPSFNREGSPILDEDGKQVEEEFEVEIPDLDENGNEQYVYSLRYEEFIGIITGVLQDNVNELNALSSEFDAYKKETEDKFAKLEAKINSIQG